ncbi:hypothetical protein CA267_006525 [Alteromonas pelagimontana]|uniref:Uncharacterized protein n=1 Tax=Alteromonas pelagimontana TaxID=1858656 RepID=A0A6M4MB92_9ALTE|nr:hypothetical protein [Alteromonas pelagimontana]QJR80452.1 hypothetical protein CA267_006525 [Alteromonas pelagimontana]
MKKVLIAPMFARAAHESIWRDKLRPVAHTLLAPRLIFDVLPIKYKRHPIPATAFLTAVGDVECRYATDGLWQKSLPAQTLLLKNFYRTILPQLRRILMTSSGVQKIAQSHLRGRRGH